MSPYLKRTVLCLAGLAAACGGDGEDLSSPNAPPAAAFGSSCADLACSFRDSSVDADGRIAGYRWSFGDASPDTTTRDVEHTYAASGSYPVTLTVTDDRGASASAMHVVRAVVPPDVPPVAWFGSSCAGLTCSFSDSSSDSDGIIVSRRWAFGDGAEDGAAAPAHSYASAGVYQVQLAVTDDRGATTGAARDIDVRAPVVDGPAIALSAASLGFCYRPASIRNCVVLRRDFSITSVGGKALTWTASSDQPWILVSPASGRTPTAVQVSIDLAKVPPHTYDPLPRVSGAITVSAAGAANGPQRISVMLYFYAVSLPW
jgi:PKD repeat protein